MFADSQQSGSPSNNEPGKNPLPGMWSTAALFCHLPIVPLSSSTHCTADHVHHALPSFNCTDLLWTRWLAERRRLYFNENKLRPGRRAWSLMYCAACKNDFFAVAWVSVYHQLTKDHQFKKKKRDTLNVRYTVLASKTFIQPYCVINWIVSQTNTQCSRWSLRVS